MQNVNIKRTNTQSALLLLMYKINNTEQNKRNTIQTNLIKNCSANVKAIGTMQSFDWNSICKNRFEYSFWIIYRFTKKKIIYILSNQWCKYYAIKVTLKYKINYACTDASVCTVDYKSSIDHIRSNANKKTHIFFYSIK